MTAKPFLEHWFKGYFGREHRRLRTADQLPELVGDRLHFEWDVYWTMGGAGDPGRDDDEHMVQEIRCAGQRVWIELHAPGWPDDVEPLLRQRYGERFAGLTRGGFGQHR